MKIHAYDLQNGDVVTSLILDPAENFVVDQITAIEQDSILVVQGYTEDTGADFTFYWGEDKPLEVTRATVNAEA
jgi:hypothetical protein